MLYHGECIEVMQGLASSSIAMILTDLPYGTTQNKWDTVIPLAPLWEQYKRVAKEDAAIVLFAQMPFAAILGASNLPMLRYEWIWQKDSATGFLNANRMPLKQHENILVFYQKLPMYHPQFTYGGVPYTRTRSHTPTPNYGKFVNSETNNTDGKRYPLDILHFHEERGLHPCQKPVPLCEYLIRTYTDPGETVLDSCMGSGTTCVAALNTGRDAIGIERDADTFAGAVRRLEERIPCLIL